ncbi:Hpt domain-containing protein [Kiloniella sp. EL199]|uniref:Hpt domain-containing protein n=1 Tax=Kiloniella sp. EL199 TaxID=2107581 RepID=UPI0013C501A7|nr:Hpt domain-containing protein [Kiloniella sp. EL199]
MSETGQVPHIDTELAEIYRAGVQDDFSALENILEKIINNPDDQFEAIDQARGIVHNIKGQGTSFGFPLITTIADSFYKLLKHELEQNALHASTPKLFEAHLKAMKSIIVNEIYGEGPDLMQIIAESLKKNVNQVIY